ncbi:hypothetical protein ACKQTC_08530 [Peptococcus simiae]|uniref:DNA-binding protein n=1 Tax=Peptococcus simiae TaxID=1643805 RepID=A0ABW9H2L0_9FIRM
MSTESTLITSLVKLLTPVLLEELEPQIDAYLESKSEELRRQAMPEIIRRKDFPEYTGYSCNTFDRWAAEGMPVIKSRGKTGAVGVRREALMDWVKGMEI